MLQANPVAHAERDEGDSSVHRRSARRLRRDDAGRRLSQRRGRDRAARRFLASPSTGPYPSTTAGSRALHWGNQRVAAGYLTADASAWAARCGLGRAHDATAGRPIRVGHHVRGGVCDADGRWIAWESSCVMPSAERCSGTWPLHERGVGRGMRRERLRRQPGRATRPGAATRQDTTSGGPATSETLVWGTSDSGDTLVWGTSCEDPSCTPVIWQE